MIKKILATFSSIVALLSFGVVPAFAHVVVHPSQVGVAAWQEFSMAVPTEKDNPTIAVKLLIPDGLKSVSPNVKPGWTIDVKKDGAGDDAKVTEIDWTGGSIPPGQRDDFLFQAQVPAKEVTLNWKAYQTYSDGSIVAWDHDPKLSKGPDDDSAPPPYSTTKVVNDLAGTQQVSVLGTSTQNAIATDGTTKILAEGAGGIALVSLVIGVMSFKRKK